MAEHDVVVPHSPVVSFFSTMHVKGEDYGEIEPNFYREYKEELGKVWRLHDSRGRGLRILTILNDDDGIPRLTTGWSKIRKFYGLKWNHSILFKYFGQNKFQIFVNDQKITPADFPTWHTKSRALRKAVTFKVTITEDPEVNPGLTLPNNMGEYMWNTMLDEVRIIGTNGERFQKDPFSVKISRGWPEVVGINGFKVGDTILFNTFHIYKDHTLWARKEE